MLKALVYLALAARPSVGATAPAAKSGHVMCALALMPLVTGCTDEARGDDPRHYTPTELRQKICVRENTCATFGSRVWYVDGGVVYTNLAPGARVDYGIDSVRALVNFKGRPVVLQRRGTLKIFGPDERGNPRWYVFASGIQEVTVEGDALTAKTPGEKTLRFDAGPGPAAWSLEKTRSAGIEIVGGRRRDFEDEYAPRLNGRVLKF